MITVPGPAQPAAAGDPAAAASAIHVFGLRKRYGDVTALADVDLVVRAGEFFTLLGPSGSGKTTLLRLIAGFERPDAGRIELAGRDVTRVPPYARNVNTVFQDYALFPHMTVAQNIEYGLRVRRVAKGQRREKVDQALEMVRLPGLGGRKPAQLSGGQRQRVALARAIVNEPDPPGTHAEPGRIRDVIYAGVLTRYVVDLDGGGELVVSRQNTEAPSAGDALSQGRQVRLAWRPEQAFTIPSGEGT